MNCNNKHFCAVKGFLFGSLIFIALTFGISSFNKSETPKNEVSYDEALIHLKSKEIKDVYLKDADSDSKKSSIVTVNFDSEPSNPLFYLFQILFWLFLISPPIIVVLLLVIINKMNKANKG